MESYNHSTYELSDMEKEMIKQFRKRLADVIQPEHTDAVILKWLRAKNFNLKNSEDIFRETLRIRKAFKADLMVDLWEMPEVLKKYEYGNHIGFAKDGTPLYYLALGRGDLQGYFLSADIYDIIKYCSCAIERDIRNCKEQSKKLGREINETTYIVDAEGFSLRQILFSGFLETCIDMLHNLQDHYPEVWKRILIVNACPYYYMAFNLVKPILRHTFVKHIRVASREHSARLLLRYVDENVLPAFLGGKRVDSNGDPMCTEFIKFGGQIPEKYYLRNRSPLLPTDAGVQTAWIAPRSVYNTFVIVRQAECTILVEQRSEGGSVGSSIFFRKFGRDSEDLDLPARDEYFNDHDQSSKVERIGPYFRCQMHTSPVDNYCFAPWPGIYIFQLDNTHNWFKSRKVIYRLRVVPFSNDIFRKRKHSKI